MNEYKSKYSSFVVDENGCEMETEYIISEPPLIVIETMTAEEEFLLACAGDSDGNIDIEVTGGVGEYTYVWSDGTSTIGNNQDINGLAIGEYSVTVTDENNCVMVENYVITEPPGVVITLDESTSFMDLLCFEDSDGSINILVDGGTGEYTYLWSNGATTQNIIGVVEGTYSVTVTDENGCPMMSDEWVISEPEELTLETESATEMLDCYGDNDGSINILVDGGVEPYAYDWSNGATTQNINGIVAGT